MIAIGLGCRKGCPASDIVTLVRDALTHLPPDWSGAALFSIDIKRHEAGMTEAAAILDMPLTFIDQAVLQLVAGEARSCSRRVEEMFGLPGIAETAALAGAGQGAVLLVARMACPTATCAIAG